MGNFLVCRKLTPGVEPAVGGGELGSNLVGFGGIEVGVDGEGFLPVVASLPVVPGGLVGAGETVVGPGLLVSGMPNGRIARSLGISIRTVDQHVETMTRRTGAESRGELVARCFVTGVLQTGTWPPVWSGKYCLVQAGCADRPKATPSQPTYPLTC